MAARRKQRTTENCPASYEEMRADAMQELWTLLDSKNETTKRWAVTKILEYADGKPTQVVQVNDAPTVIIFETAARTPSFDTAIEHEPGEVSRVAIAKPRVGPLSLGRLALEQIDDGE